MILFDFIFLCQSEEHSILDYTSGIVLAADKRTLE